MCMAEPLSKSPSLSPSPPQFPRKKFESNTNSSNSNRTSGYSGNRGGGNFSDSDSGIVPGMRDLSLRPNSKTPTHQFDNR